jgi:hypothetical protein
VLHRLSTFFRVCATVVAVHGAVFGLVDLSLRASRSDLPEPLQPIAFALLYLPAMFLAAPLRPLLWSAGLIEAPGWFTWPKPLGFVLSYSIWILALGAAAFVLRRRSR